MSNKSLQLPVLIMFSWSLQIHLLEPFCLSALNIQKRQKNTSALLPIDSCLYWRVRPCQTLFKHVTLINLLGVAPWLENTWYSLSDCWMGVINSAEKLHLGTLGNLGKGSRTLMLLQILQQGASQNCLSAGEIAFPNWMNQKCFPAALF